MPALTFWILIAVSCEGVVPSPPPADPRDLRTGRVIPTIHYSDQPFVVKTDDGAWLCAVTTGPGREGQAGQIVTTMRSLDQGRTWSKPLAVEVADGRETSYAVLLKAPRGRIFIFYNHNTDNLRQIPADKGPGFPDGVCRRVDCLGSFVFKYSDDGGCSWSPKRYPIPVREMDIDRQNAFLGKVRYFWNVGRPFLHRGAAYVSLHKVGGIGEGFFTRSEGVLLKSPNLATEQDPQRITWETLPDGDFGLRAPPGGGPIAEEQSYSVLSDGSFYCVYRTIDGHPAFAYSRDAGHTWTVPDYQRYADGRLMKHPRAANFAWKCANGKYLYWFHNHGGRFIREHPQRRTMSYEDRNPAWLCGGIEAESPQGKIIRWSQPEIVLYDDDPYVRMSYPDLIEDGGKYYLTETQKNIARVHELDSRLLEGLWNQFSNRRIAAGGVLLQLPEGGQPTPAVCLPSPHSPSGMVHAATTARRICGAASPSTSGYGSMRSARARRCSTTAPAKGKGSACRRPAGGRWRSCSTTGEARAAGTATRDCCARARCTTWWPASTAGRRSSPSSWMGGCATAAMTASSAGGVSTPTSAARAGPRCSASVKVSAAR